MRNVAMTTAWIGLAALAVAYPLPAQMQNNTEKKMTCENGSSGDRARHCEIREQTVPGVGRLGVDAAQNGGVTVRGWTRNDVLVRSRVDTSADTQIAADTMASRVLVDSSGGQVRAMGPEAANNTSWSVSYEIFVPQNTDLNLKGNNGGMTVSDVRGQMHFDVKNGGVHLAHIAGDVSGTTVNGGIQVDLVGSTWEGRQMELTTNNGGVTIAMPKTYSAHFQAETGNGGIQSDFPLATQSNLKSHHLDFSVGAGGPIIHVTTGNGGIRLKHAESQAQ